MMRRTVLITFMLLAAGCAPPDDQETGSLRGEDIRQTRDNLPAELVEALDSGNAAYRRGDYQDALTDYREAIEVNDGVAAGWFGLYMAHQALGNPEAADSALARAQDLAPGATMIHPERDTAQ